MTTEIDEINLKIEAAIVQDKKDEDLFDHEPDPTTEHSEDDPHEEEDDRKRDDNEFYVTFTED